MNDILDRIETMHKDELETLRQAIKNRYEAISRRNLLEYKKGDRVSFEDKHGRKITGTIDRVNQKSVSIIQEGERLATWRVHPSFLTKEE